MDFNAPPPRSSKVPKALASMRKVMEDEKAMAEIKELSTGLLFYDPAGPSTRKRRETARVIFEGYCEQVLGRDGLAPTEMYNKETIIERTYETIMLLAVTAEGKIGAKPKAGVLYQYKEALYCIFVQWHNMANAAVHKAAITHGFETEWREKTKLTVEELELFWNQISKFTTGRENWKQHYTIWILVFMTAVRPGSLTVCYGYEKGTLLAVGGNVTRESDETLRWSDIEFFRAPGGLGLKIMFRYLKGYRDPQRKKQMVSGKRTFTFLPINSSRYFLDLTLLLTGLAFSRGLFKYESLEALYGGQEKVLELDEEVKKQAVFVASGQDTKLQVDKALHESGLNPKLQEMCEAVGLFQRNTMYSLRRTAITEVRRKHGTEMAQELAVHIPGGKSLYAYDDETLQDIDLANDRLNLQTMTRAEIRRMFSQSNMARVKFDDSIMLTGPSAQSLQESLRAESIRRARADPQYEAAEDAVRQHCAQITQLLGTLGVDTALFTTEQLYKDHLREYEAVNAECGPLIAGLEKLQSTRLLLLRQLKERHRADIKKEMLEHAKKAQKVAATAGKTGARGRTEAEPLSEKIASIEDPTQQAERAVVAVESLTDPAANEEEDNEGLESDDERMDHTHGEPMQWENLPDALTVVVEPDEGESPPTAEGRFRFVKAFLEMQSAQTSGLTCLPCKLDETVPYEMKTKTYTRSKLDTHLKSGYHMRATQLQRAWVIDYGKGKSKGECPLCGKMCTAANWIKHVDENHDEQFAD
ncbi:hypothetical protein BAUCODRAFT_23062 [Baudoinia panamericana UAMH 10762]|uniref:Uncharacterized protein n=1 Tax=Baudoinia panamericana (strain UAMH 10762) TaxID=717646 RepID=M2MNJ0_BAUPA|nr:uncharacterized protein BAUCODRAFT_23062 [Baudoinia panamericana UAMH 10762]EMC98256.1 hypothetical protein BAUCODRAFT_23062 [Baudoinia panamericana UAMH 10762]